jgi:hypothetical protein
VISACAPEIRAQKTVDPEQVQKNHFRWGVYEDSPESLDKLIKDVGKTPDIVAIFAGLDAEGYLPQEIMDEALKNKSDLLIYLETTENNSEMMDEKTRGYVRTLAEKLKKYPGKIILVPMPEMNGDWSAWDKSNPKNTSETFKISYRMIVDEFKKRGVDNIEFGWAVNETTDSIDPYYPGSEYVNDVGVDGFNQGQGEWRNPEEIFGSTIDQLDKYNKPIYIFSTGSEEGVSKARWMTDLFVFAKLRKLKGLIYFDENKKDQGERNWKIASDAESLNSFVNAINNLPKVRLP